MRLLHFSLLFTFITGFNTSEDDPDPSQFPYTDSDSELASPSQDGSTTVTRLPDTFGFRNAYMLWTASAHQGGGYSGLGDKTRLRFVPQERTHNGQEKAGAMISDPAYTDTHDTHSLTDSKLSFTAKVQDSSLSSSQTKWPGLSVSTLTTATRVYSNTDENTLPEKAPSTTKIYSDTHHDTATPLVRSDVFNALESKIVHSNEITVLSSAPTLGKRPYLTTLGNKAPVTELEKSESHGYQDVTDRRDLSMMSSSYTTSEERNESHHSSETFRNNHIPHPNHINQKNLDSTITDESISLRDSVSDHKVTEFNSVTYISDSSVRSPAYTDMSEMEASQTNRLPRSTHISDNISNHTHVSLFNDSSTVTDTPRASVLDHKIDTSMISDHLDASESVTATNRKGTEYYSHTPYYTYSPNTDSTPTDSATTQSSYTVHSEDTTVNEQTTNQQSDAKTQYTLSETLPTQSPLRSSSVTSTRQDFTSTSVSYSPNTLGDPTSVLLSVITTHRNNPATTPEGPITATNGTKETKSTTGTEVWTHNDDQVTEMSTVTSDLNNPSHITSLSTESGPTTVTHQTSSTSGDDPATHTNPAFTSPLTHTLNSVTTSTPPVTTSQTSHLIMTTRGAETRTENHLTTSRNTQIIQRPDATTTTVTTATIITAPPTTAPITTAPPTTATAAATTTTQQVHTNTRSQPETHTTLTPVITQMPSHRPFTRKTDRDWSRKGQVFIMDDQPAVINVETFQVLLQVILEENAAPSPGLVEVEPFLQKVAGYQSQHVTWHSGPVLQSVATFKTAEAVSWLGRVESLLQEAGLKPLPEQGFFVSDVRVKNITVGGLHTDVCSWLFSCLSDFYCVSSEGNVTCRSVCHSEYCKNHGICVHRSGQNPLCQCPVGEDFWFMGQRCDLRMTRQRLAGVCFGVLASIAVLMGLLAYLAVQRFKKTLIQAKAEQTQSSYRRFNHFDELSARFWRRSWPGSADSLDNTAFSRSDELLHMRALDRTCCYHDDTLSIASTYPESVTHLNTVYPHSSQYHWDMSTCSLADGVIDSGKASDLSVCSWPIEPIQWTPFPLLQQLKNADTIKPSRPRSYCEGMELVGLEKSRTA